MEIEDDEGGVDFDLPYVDEEQDIPHLEEFHAHLAECREAGQSVPDFHGWHMEKYGNFGNS